MTARSSLVLAVEAILTAMSCQYTSNRNMGFIPAMTTAIQFTTRIKGDIFKGHLY